MHIVLWMTSEPQLEPNLRAGRLQQGAARALGCPAKASASLHRSSFMICGAYTDAYGLATLQDLALRVHEFGSRSLHR